MLSPSEVKAKAQKLEEQNLKFRSFLKNRADDDELDAQFRQLHRELFADYDCCKCNNCCKAYPITLGHGEAAAIAEFFGQSKAEFIEEYLTENPDSDEDEGEYAFKSVPCSFLDETGRCRIQSCKPDVCKGYPYTDQPDRLSSMLSIIGSAEECPVVFEILERLKVMYRFRGNR
ncbi:Fe-S oxidoreductase [Clostridia bacterium]|nr:Fe-S oxidoreductase [Clostridia bacterium]